MRQLNLPISNNFIHNTRLMMKNHYSNGAVAYKLDESTPCWYITESNAVKAVLFNSETCMHLLDSMNLFDSKDAAKRVLKITKVKARLEKKILEINAKNNWKLNWNDPTQVKYTLLWDHNPNKPGQGTRGCIPMSKMHISGGMCMCEQAKDYMLSKLVTDQEFKLFLGIIED